MSPAPGPDLSPATPGPDWYDVLDVDPSASTEEIREAWRAATVDLTPADRRFRLYSRAAEVLLDPERRAAYDAERAREEPPEETSPETPPPGPPDSLTRPDAARPAGSQRRSRREALTALGAGLRRPFRRQRPPAGPTPDSPAGPGDVTGRVVPTWLLVAVGLLALLALGASAYLWATQPSPESVEDATGEARSAAEGAIEPLLSYDYRDLEGSREAAEDVVTDDYRSEYEKFFEGVVQGNAERTETVVQAQLVSSAVVRGDEERVEVLLFVDQATTNVQVEEPVVYKNQARVIMERVGDEWLVDCVLTEPDGTCGN